MPCPGAGLALAVGSRDEFVCLEELRWQAAHLYAPHTPSMNTFWHMSMCSMRASISSISAAREQPDQRPNCRQGQGRHVCRTTCMPALRQSHVHLQAC